jgi:hypothetical protein
MPAAAPTDSVQGLPSLVDASVLDFWRWAFADLSDDDVKGYVQRFNSVLSR